MMNMERVEIKLGLAKDGYPVFFLAGEKEGDKEQFLASHYSPRKEAERILDEGGSDKQEVSKCDMIFILGAGNPNLLLLAMEKYRFIPIVVIENHRDIRKQFLKWFQESHPQMFSSDQDRLLWADDDIQDEDLRGWFKEHTVKKILFFQNQKQISWYPVFYAGIKDRIIRIHNQRASNRSTISRFEKIWLRNITQNTELIIKSYPLFLGHELGKDRPVVIVGAGPSLEEILEDLAEIQDRVVIITCDTAMKVLLHHGITPDLVVVVDPQKVNSKYLENIPRAMLSHTILVSEPGVAHHGIRDFPYTMMFDSIFPYYQLLKNFFNPKGEIDVGGTVISAAYEVVKIFSFSPIAFVGMDFCFQEDKYHLKGSMYEEIFFSCLHRFQTFEMFYSRIIDNDVIPTLNHLGETVYIDRKFMLFKNWLEKKFADDQPQGYNCSRGGMDLKGLPFMNFTDFVATHILPFAGSPKSEWMKGLRDKITEFQKQRSMQNPDFRKVFDRFKIQYQNVLSSIVEYKTLLKKILGLIRNKQSQRIISLQEEVINGKSAKIAKPFVETVIQKTLYSIQQSEDSEENNSYNSLKRLYEELSGGCDLNLKYLGKVRFEGEPLAENQNR